MSLIIQIQTIAYTFLFGIIVSLLFNLLYKILFTKKIIINFITNFLFMFIMSSLYFYFLLKVNDGVIHIYLLFIFLISFFLYYRIFRKIRCVGWWFNKSWKSFNFLVLLTW